MSKPTVPTPCPTPCRFARHRRLVVLASAALAACSEGGAASLTTADATGSGGPPSGVPGSGTDPHPSPTSLTSGDPPVPDSTTSGGDDDNDDTTLLDVGAPTWEPGDDIPTTCDAVGQAPATSVGCLFYAMDVPGGGTLPYGISVGNPSPEPALVRLEDRRGPGGALRQIAVVSVEPGGSELIEVNGAYPDGTGGILLGEDHAPVPPTLLFEGDTAVFSDAAFRITADVPITAMQIGPVGGGPSAVAEASMLLPGNALDTAYLTIGWEGDTGFKGESTAWVFVVAAHDATTVSTSYGDAVLDEFDVLQLAPGEDASGLFIDADQPVAVFSGAPCVDIGGRYCDHIEEQVFPLSSWGTQYVAARHPARVPELSPNLPEPVFWRVYGAVDGSTITLEPPNPERGAVVQVDFGEWVDLQSNAHFVATSDDPFLLVQYMTGCVNVLPPGNNCQQWGVASGDPYMAQMVPVEQWITRAPFLTDASYPRDFVVVSREIGTQVDLACLGALDDDRFVRVGASPFEVASVDLDIADLGGEGDCQDGAQYLTASKGVGLLVGGVDFASSYGYPGGMFLNPTWTPPAG